MSKLLLCIRGRKAAVAADIWSIKFFGEDWRPTSRRVFVKHIELKPHERPRITDNMLLTSSNKIRERQPERNDIQGCFRGRMLSLLTPVAMNRVWHLEHLMSKKNPSSHGDEPRRRPMEHRALGHDVPGPCERAGDKQGPQGTDFCEELLVVHKGVRLRLTRNLDKDRGFINGTVVFVEHMLRKDVFVESRLDGTFLLVHPITVPDGRLFVAATHAYATTMRRVQRATLAAVAMRFDRRNPNRGCAFAGLSREMQTTDAFLISPRVAPRSNSSPTGRLLWSQRRRRRRSERSELW